MANQDLGAIIAAHAGRKVRKARAARHHRTGHLQRPLPGGGGLRAAQQIFTAAADGLRIGNLRASNLLGLGLCR